jgi:hypothetical protein
MFGKKRNNNIELKIKPTGWKRARRMLLRLLLFVIIFIFTLSLSFIILSQTQQFRHWFYGYVLDYLNSELDGKIYADDIKLSPFEGLKITNLRIIASNDTLASVGSLTLHYSFSSLFSQYLYVKSIDVKNARIKLIRYASDSTWNFEKIAKKTPDDPNKKKLDWIFDIKQLSLKNTDIEIDDRTMPRNTMQFDPLHSKLSNMNLNLRAKADLKKKIIFAEIKQLNFKELNSGITVRDLVLKLNTNTNNIEISNFAINSNYFQGDIYAKTDGINIFDGVEDNEINSSTINLNLKIKELNLLLINKIGNSLPAINDKIDLEAKVSGNMKNIKLSHIRIDKGSSYIISSGKIENVLNQEELTYDITLSNSNLYDSDFRKIKSDLNIDFASIDRLFVRRLNVRGNLEKLNIESNIESTFGDVDGFAELDLIGKPSYDSKIKLHRFNIGQLLNDASMTSNINGEVTVIGSGLSTNDINAIIGCNLINSHFQNYDIENLNLKGNLHPAKKVNIDTLSIMLRNSFKDSTNLSLSNSSKINISGAFDFLNEKMPIYALKINLSEFNFASLLRSNIAPQYFDSNIDITGKGFHPDSIESKIKAEINACVFGNRALMPFNIDINVERFGKTGRLILLNSELFNLQLVGEYQLEDFISIAENQVTELVTFINKKVFTFFYNNPDSLNYYFRHKKRGPLKPFTMDLTGEIKDLTPIGIAVGQPYLSGNAKLDFYVDVEPYRSVMNIRNLDVTSFQYKDGIANIAINPTTIKGIVDLRMVDSLPVFDKVALSINGKTETFINELSFLQPRLNFSYSGDTLDINLSSDFNKIFRLDAVGKMNFSDLKFALNLDSARIAMNDDFKWQAAEPIKVELTSDGLDFQKFIFKRDSSERISLFGKINTSVANNVVLEVTDFPLTQSAYFLPDAQKMYAKNTKGKLQKLNLVINDSLNDPSIQVKFNTNDVYFYNRLAGKFYGSFEYANQNLAGAMILKDSASKKDIVTATLNTLPIDLSIQTGGQRIIDNRKIDMSIVALNAPLNLVNPFLPEVITNMNGIGDARLDITGKKYNLDYQGYINAHTASFLSTVNNMYYNATGNIKIDNENISLNSLEVRNDKNDLSNSLAFVDGGLIFRDFNIERFDIYVKSKSIKLLDFKSIKTMPDLYGDFVISSGKNPIRFHGTFTDPYLEGDVNILRAKINMPLVETRNQIPKSRFIYEIKGKKLTVQDTKNDSLLSSLMNNTSDTLVVQKNKPEQEAPDFADILNYNLDVTFVNPMEVNMEMPIGEVFAIVTTKIPNSPIHYYVNPKINAQRIQGDLVLKNNSTFKYIKLFNVTGDILFPTGDMNNPGLSLKAEYLGKSTVNNNIRNYTVNMYIRGSKNNPQVSFDYSIDDELVKGDSSKIREDALFLMLFGVTKAEFEKPSSSSGKASPIDDLGAASIAAVLSKSVTEMLSGTGFITSADIDLQGGSFQNAKLKLSGQIFGMTWNVGGTIADVMNGYEFTAEIPVGLLLFPETLKSLFLQFTTSVNPTSYVSRNQKNWEVKIKFGGDF